MLIHLKEDVIKDEVLKAKIRKLDARAHQLLLWSSICSLWSYLVLIVVIARIYLSFYGKHPALLLSCLLVIYILIGVFIYFACKGMAGLRSDFYTSSKSYITYQVKKLSAQRGLIAYYLLEYALITVVSGMFFYWGVQNGLTALFKLTAPVSMITYVLGFYFIGRFTRQIKKLELAKLRVNQQLMERIAQN